MENHIDKWLANEERERKRFVAQAIHRQMIWSQVGRQIGLAPSAPPYRLAFRTVARARGIWATAIQ